MNKAERHRLKMKKYKKRLRQLGLTNQKGNFFAYRSHGKPCSCSICSSQKYRYNRNRKNYRFNIETEAEGAITP